MGSFDSTMLSNLSVGSLIVLIRLCREQRVNRVRPSARTRAKFSAAPLIR